MQEEEKEEKKEGEEGHGEGGGGTQGDLHGEVEAAGGWFREQVEPQLTWAGICPYPYCFLVDSTL